MTVQSSAQSPRLISRRERHAGEESERLPCEGWLMAGGSCWTLATAIAACADQLRFLTGRHGVARRPAHPLAAEAEHLKDLLCSVMKAIIWGQKEIHFGNHFC